jgi:hypothetical protein
MEATENKEAHMEATFSPKPSELIFPPQAPFSWTLRWARQRREREQASTPATAYRISGSARNTEELAAAIAFCEQHSARLERD